MRSRKASVSIIETSTPSCSAASRSARSRESSSSRSRYWKPIRTNTISAIAATPVRRYTPATNAHNSALSTSDGRTGTRIVRISAASEVLSWKQWSPATIRKLMRFVTRKTASTSSGKPAPSGSIENASVAQRASRPPITGKVANVARFVIRRGNGLRARRWSSRIAATPIAAAGAGPSSVIASTSARNEPEIRCPP